MSDKRLTKLAEIWSRPEALFDFTCVMSVKVEVQMHHQCCY